MKRAWIMAALLAGLAALLPAQALDDVLASYYQANGGLEKLQALKSLKVSGTMTLPDMNVQMPVQMWLKSPAQMRSEMHFREQLIVQACDGQTAWWIMPLLGVSQPQAMPADQAAEARRQAEFADPLVVWKERGWSLTLQGRETLGTALVYRLKLLRGDGREVAIYIDAASGLELKTATTGGDGAAVARMEILFTDYRPVDGVLRPFKLDTLADGVLKSTLQVSAWEINPAIDDALFRLPAPDAPR